MVQINIDTDKDSPETIKKIIEMLHVALGNQSTSNAPSSVYGTSSLPSSAPIKSSSNPFEVFNSESSQSHSLPSSAPVSNEPSMFDTRPSAQKSSGIFDVFGAEDRPNSQSSQPVSSQSVASSNPFGMFDEPTPSTTEKNTSAGFANNDLFDSFSNGLPSTDFNSQSSNQSFGGLDASFESAQTLLDNDFNPIQNEEPEEDDEPEQKSSNFFSFEQY